VEPQIAVAVAVAVAIAFAFAFAIAIAIAIAHRHRPTAIPNVVLEMVVIGVRNLRFHRRLDDLRCHLAPVLDDVPVHNMK
jgi:hypothetical protein